MCTCHCSSIWRHSSVSTATRIRDCPIRCFNDSVFNFKSDGSISMVCCDPRSTDRSFHHSTTPSDVGKLHCAWSAYLHMHGAPAWITNTSTANRSCTKKLGWEWDLVGGKGLVVLFGTFCRSNNFKCTFTWRCRKQQPQHATHGWEYSHANRPCMQGAVQMKPFL